MNLFFRAVNNESYLCCKVQRTSHLFSSANTFHGVLSLTISFLQLGIKPAFGPRPTAVFLICPVFLLLNQLVLTLCFLGETQSRRPQGACTVVLLPLDGMPVGFGSLKGPTYLLQQVLCSNFLIG